LPAIWSFTELLRRAAGAELDIDPSEIQAGLQALSVGVAQTRRIFLADALENGAGYARRLREPAVMRAVLDRLDWDARSRILDARHVAACDSSCPDCLRSYDNRLLHGLLDWRLALDLADLALARPLDTGRWLDGAIPRRGPSSKARRRRARPSRYPMPGRWTQIVAPSTGGAVILTHPLWRGIDEPQWWTDAQSAAYAAAMDASGGEASVRFVDLWHLQRRPELAFRHLVAPDAA
jgi:DEAD/DEAH box helicase domain-containing protein